MGKRLLSNFVPVQLERIKQRTPVLPLPSPNSWPIMSSAPSPGPEHRRRRIDGLPPKYRRARSWSCSPASACGANISGRSRPSPDTLYKNRIVFLNRSPSPAAPRAGRPRGQVKSPGVVELVLRFRNEQGIGFAPQHGLSGRHPEVDRDAARHIAAVPVHPEFTHPVLQGGDHGPAHSGGVVIQIRHIGPVGILGMD